MTLVEHLCVIGLASAIAIPAMLCFRDAKTDMAQQAARVSIYTASLRSPLPGMPPQPGKERQAQPSQESAHDGLR